MQSRLAALRFRRDRIVVDRLDDRDEGINRLVMVASSAWQWPVDERTCRQHRRLLRELGAPVAGSHALGRPVPVQPSTSPVDRSWGGAEVRPTQEWGWHTGPAAASAVDELTAGLVDFCAHWDGRDAREALQRLRHRVYLDAAQLHAAIGAPADARSELDHHVLLDFQLTGYLDQLSCALSVSVWSGYPFEPEHAPRWLLRDRRDAGQLTGSLVDYHRLFSQVHERVERWFAGVGRGDGAPRRTRAEFRIGRREYRLPVIWVAVPSRTETEADRYLEKRSSLLNGLAAITLRVGDARDCVVTTSVLNGQLLTLRRFLPVENDRSVPCYLVVPEAVADDADPGTQEAMTAVVVQALVELEAKAAELLFHVHNELDVLRTQLDVYDRVAERGLVLWDALSTHLPVRRWGRLGRVHRAVEMLHQVLLQGIADLARLETRTRDCVSQVEAATEELLEDYDGVITEYHPTQPNGLRFALAKVGLMGDVRQTGENAVARAARVKKTYDDLLSAISSAFDERRVRESDSLQKASAVLGVALAVIGLVTVLDAAVQMKPEDLMAGIFVWREARWLSVAAMAATLAIGLVFLAVVVPVVVAAARSGRIGSRWFRHRYDGAPGWPAAPGMWHFLKDSSSDVLNAVPDTVPPDSASSTWQDRDAALAARFARLWDLTGSPVHEQRGHNVAEDIERLSYRVEQWGLRTLLVTERPWGAIARYRLPRLTMLYRACAWLPNSFLTGSGTSVVSDNDFYRSLQRLGFTWDEAVEVDLRFAARVRSLHGDCATAAAVLRLIRQWGLHADLDRSGVDAVLRRIRQPATAVVPRQGRPAR